MRVINVYDRYFRAELVFNNIPRRGARVMLIATSDAGTIRYEAAVTFFPYRDEEDFCITYDAYFSKELYSANGRRSKKREGILIEGLRKEIDELAGEHGGVVFWEQPVTEEIRG